MMVILAVAREAQLQTHGPIQRGIHKDSKDRAADVPPAHRRSSRAFFQQERRYIPYCKTVGMVSSTSKLDTSRLDVYEFVIQRGAVK